MSSPIQARLEGRRRIYLARHADVSYFSSQGAALDTRTVPLNSVGRAQAEQLRDLFRGLTIDRVVVSGLTRTRETASLILSERSMEVEECADLEEIRPGKIRAWAPELAASPTELEEYFIGSLTGEITSEATFLGGESYGAFVERVVPAFERLVARPGWREMLVVAHGGTNRALLAHMLGANVGAMGTIEQDPACVNVIDVDTEPARSRAPNTAEPPNDAARARYLIRLLNFTAGSQLKRDNRLTTMEKIFMESRDAIVAMAQKGAS